MNRGETETALSRQRFDAFVFDLDGVVTRTAQVHASAWKRMFDDFLERRGDAGEAFAPFDVADDYRQYVDGKPRYAGVRSFLASRGIELPEGTPQDDPAAATICGLGNRKNRLFRELLQHDGVEVYDSTVDLVRDLRAAGLRVAVVSSSRNCQAVLEAAGLSALFDARVDGNDLQRLGLRGKPAPDMFREAARRLDCDPGRAVAVEDATAGVQAAAAAGFGVVVGVNRGDYASALREHGADIVVADLGALQFRARADTDAERTTPASSLPSALESIDQILAGHAGEPALFLDYDGTLTPIVSRPEDAVLSDAMRVTLQRLGGLCPIAVISGRDLDDVRGRVDTEGLWYAGSHGFDIAGPGGERNTHQQGIDHLPALDRAERALRDQLRAVTGCQVERKRFSIAVHYRRVAEDRAPAVERSVVQVQAGHPELRLTRGKKIYELQPDIDWDKGKALRWLLQALDADPARRFPIYLGDDVTDEDAFRALQGDGVGILVGAGDQPTRATYRLADPSAAQVFLDRLANRLEGAQP